VLISYLACAFLAPISAVHLTYPLITNNRDYNVQDPDEKRKKSGNYEKVAPGFEYF
jgi:hypothetical protein